MAQPCFYKFSFGDEAREYAENEIVYVRIGGRKERGVRIGKLVVGMPARALADAVDSSPTFYFALSKGPTRTYQQRERGYADMTFEEYKAIRVYMAEGFSTVGAMMAAMTYGSNVAGGRAWLEEREFIGYDDVQPEVF